MAEQHEFSMSMDGSLIPCRFCKETHQPPPDVMRKLLEAKEWQTKRLELEDLDKMAQRHLEALHWIHSLAVDLTQAKLQLGMDAIQTALGDVPRLIIEVRRAQTEGERATS